MDLPLFITNPTNIRYLTGFDGMAEHERDGYVLLTLNKLYLFTGPLYLESAKNAKCPMPNVKLKIIQISNEKTIWKRLKEVFDSIPRSRNTKVGFEEVDLKVAEFNTLRKELKGITLIPTKNHIEEIRMIKREDEIENIREAAMLTDECFTYIIGKLKPGVTEAEIAWEIESHVYAGGAHELAFSPIVAFGKNSSQPHYQASNKRRPFDSAQGEQDSILKNNNVVLLDFGARINGYCSDMTRVIFVGKPNPAWIRAYETVLRAQESAINYLRAQGRALNLERSGKKADQLARAIIKEAGFPVYPHSLGHGVGLAIHEAPRLTIKKDATLKPGPSDRLRTDMVVTVEPGIYIEGQYGIRIEDLILLKSDGIEIFTKSTKDIIKL